ncbi:unnamed protein product [Protopolystoma xenopodis]|uniref:Uncharacterized protein n=1 Tax=Protopolystoma xenopodis TaxID=117903 RepID=A0A3S4ZQH4_9PLAT|nr:unnamed protein product [Protopolystoma xenopodis]
MVVAIGRRVRDRLEVSSVRRGQTTLELYLEHSHSFNQSSCRARLCLDDMRTATFCPGSYSLQFGKATMAPHFSVASFGFSTLNGHFVLG